MTSDLSVIVDSNDELIAESFCLSKGICVTKVNHVVAVIVSNMKVVLDRLGQKKEKFFVF